jgi:hypothetical protein
MSEVPVGQYEAALRHLETLRAMQTSIDGFVMPPTPRDARSRPRGYSALPISFFVSLAVALESSPHLAATLLEAKAPISAAEIRDMLRHGEALLPLAEEMERFARGIRHTVFLRRGNVGRIAAAAYRIAKELNLLQDASVPVPEVESMKRAVTRRKAEPQPDPVTVPVKK